MRQPATEKRLIAAVCFVLYVAAMNTGCSAAKVEEQKPVPTTRQRADKSDVNLKLLEAIEKGNIDAVRQAVREGADVNDAGAGYRVLGHAIMRGEISIVRELLKAGADPNATTIDGAHVPMLHLAIYRYASSPEIVEVLLASGAKANSTTTDGLDALGYAAICDAPVVCGPLVRAGADVNRRNPRASGEMHTPLMIAASMGHVGTVYILLALGADPELRDANGKTALMLTGTEEDPVADIRRYLKNPKLVSRIEP